MSTQASSDGALPDFGVVERAQAARGFLQRLVPQGISTLSKPLANCQRIGPKQGLRPLLFLRGGEHCGLAILAVKDSATELLGRYACIHVYTCIHIHLRAMYLYAVLDCFTRVHMYATRVHAIVGLHWRTTSMFFHPESARVMLQILEM